MRELPGSWVWATFVEVARVASDLVDPVAYRDARHVAPNHIESLTGRLSGVQTVATDGVESAKHRFRSGQILYSKIRPYLAKATLVDFDGVCSADMYPIDSFVDTRFLLYWMLSSEFTALAAAHQGRSVLPKINQAALANLGVPVAPLAEQERIVVAIEEAFSNLDAGEAGLRTVRQRLNRMRDAVLLAAVSGRLVPEVATDVPAAKILADLGVESLQDEELPPVPNRWAYARLGELADVVGGVTKDAKRQDDPGFVKVPYLRVANVQRGYLDLSQVTTIRVAPQKAEQLRLLRGDILFNEGGDRDKLGRGWIWEDQVAGCIHQNHVFRGRLRDPRLQPKIVSWWGNSFGKKWFEAHGKQTTNLASLNLTTLKSFPVVVAPVDEQSRIVAEVERQFSFIQACERTIDAGLARSAALRRAVLKAAFEGKLARQDPSDERASALLERVRAEREDAGVTPKRPQRARVGPS